MLSLIFLLILPYHAYSQCLATTYEEVSLVLNCSQITIDNLQVPAGKTLHLNLTDGAAVTFTGNISFGFSIWDGPLVTINGSGLIIRGAPGSFFDGRGTLYWDGQGGWSGSKPQFFTLEVNNSTFQDITIINSPKDIVQVTNSDSVLLTNWFIDDSAGDPGVAAKGKEGHNTDAFDIWNSTNVVITNSKAYIQDDCVAIRCGANISISDIYCHGSHGLSISAGFSNDSIKLNTVQNVSFFNSIVEDGRNGMHIKTHVDGGYGNITGVLYKNITLKGITYNGILIEQNYRNMPPSLGESVEPRNNIPIRNLVLEDVVGSVAEKATPIEIVCAVDGCFDWQFTRVDVTGDKDNQCNYLPENFTC